MTWTRRGALARCALLGIGLVLAGCATIKNTPQQDYVWSCVEACKAKLPPQCQVGSVDTDGQISYLCMGTRANLDEFTQCVQTQQEERPFAAWQKDRAK
jgi:hypothetical protein